LRSFQESVGKVQVLFNVAGITGTLHEELYIRVYIDRLTTGKHSEKCVVASLDDFVVVRLS